MAPLKRVVVPAVIVLLLVAAAFTMFRGDDTKTLTAHFPRTISIYEGSDVRVLGVPVGTVDKVTPSGTDVVVTMHYDADVQVPADAKAVIVAPSIVGDRFVQLTPVYDGRRRAGRRRDARRRTAPRYRSSSTRSTRSLDDLTVALGPTGANKDGALTDLLETHRRELRRPGREVQPDHQGLQQAQRRPSTTTRRSCSAPPASSRASSARSPPTTRPCAASTTRSSDVSSMLSGEREELSAGAAQPRDRARPGLDASSRRTATSSAATSPGSTGSRRSWSSIAASSTRSSTRRRSRSTTSR